jgi:hypothetical protein
VVGQAEKKVVEVLEEARFNKQRVLDRLNQLSHLAKNADNCQLQPAEVLIGRERHVW